MHNTVKQKILVIIKAKKKVSVFSGTFFLKQGWSFSLIFSLSDKLAILGLLLKLMLCQQIAYSLHDTQLNIALFTVTSGITKYISNFIS